MVVDHLAAIKTSDHSKQKELDILIHSHKPDEWTIVRALKYLVDNKIDFECIFLKVEPTTNGRNGSENDPSQRA